MNNDHTRFLDQPRPRIQAGILQGRTDTTTLAAHDFDVDVRSGFMPPDSPLARLPSNWEFWEELLDEPSRRPFPLGDSLINVGQDGYDRSDCWRARVRQMPLLDARELQSSETLLRRAHLVLAFILHIYVHSSPTLSTTLIPKSLATPLLQVSNFLQLPPVLTYSDTVLYNWRKKDEQLPLSEANIEIVTLLSGTPDEAHFYLTSAFIELRGVQALNLMRASMNEAFVADATAVRRVTEYLRRLAEVIVQLTEILCNVKISCQPNVFFHAIRPWLKGVDSSPHSQPNWIFQDVEEQELVQPSELSGPSAGQSSLIYAMDIFLGIHEASHSTIPAGHTKPFLERMKLYMPRHHRAFLDHLSGEPRSIRHLVLSSRNQKLTDAFNLAICRLKEFRDQHIQVVALYIITQSHQNLERSNQIVVKGTGGTDTIPFLKEVRDRTRDSQLRL